MDFELELACIVFRKLISCLIKESSLGDTLNRGLFFAMSNKVAKIINNNYTFI